jgi:lysophospholipase L1-like esterase
MGVGRKAGIWGGVGAALLGVAGVLAWFFWPSDDDPLPLEPDPITLPAESPRYVALGDSYSAGEGVRPFSPDSRNLEDGGDRCHRSIHAYPLRLQFTGPVERAHRACSGAETKHLYESVQLHGGQPVSLGRQAEGQLGSEVGLVTLTMGGNDAGFADVLVFCALRRSCLDDRFEGHDTLVEWGEATLQEVADAIPAVYGRLRDDAGNARIVVLGYPRLFSERSTERRTCIAYEALFSDRERDRLNQFAMRLNRVIEGAAVGAGLEYVELSYVFAGHEACAEDGAWLQFVSSDPGFQDGNFHPTRNGQTMMARTVACYLTIVAEPPDADTDGVSSTDVTGPPVGAPIEEVQQPVSTGPTGDLGDALYDCAAGVRTEEPLDRGNPPVVEVQDYSAPSSNSTAPTDDS